MKYEKGIVQVYAGHVDDILNAGLRVLFFDESAGPGEGEAFTLEEVSREVPTGRKFFARVMHAIDPQVVQFNLEPFMEDVNAETGKPERMPMAGEFANEKHSVPESVIKALENSDRIHWSVKTKGEKALWMYRGVKWIGEYSIAEIKFTPDSCEEIKEGKPPVPNLLYLKVQGSGGEAVYAFELDGLA